MTAFALSKPYMDVGLFTNRGAEMREFYGDEVGLEPMDELDIESGYRLYRFDARGSALKINDLDEPMEPAVTGFRRIILPVEDHARARALEDPDGNSVLLAPMGEMDVTQLGIGWAVASLERAEDFAERALGAERLAAGRYRVGETTLIFEEEAEAKRSGAMEAIGFTYTTLHVKDVFGTHAHLIAAGCQEAIPVTPFGEVTTYSFIRDPFGGWFEVSQRADLAGSLARVEGPVLGQDEIRAIRQSA
jgi:catechol 2,3-dioxygenase-like lactoylglutathione lyase family enzyme